MAERGGGDRELDESHVDPCPEAEALVEFARGRLARAAGAIVGNHVRGCAECGQVLMAFTRGAAGANPAEGQSGVDSKSDPPTGSTSRPASASLTLDVKPGDVLAAKYRVERVIGVGGMGVVVAASHLQLGHEVALKFMRPQAFAADDAAVRFLREARAAAQMQGEHVARVTDMGTLENGAPFMVMELLRGMDLANVLRTRGPLPVDDALDYVLQACEALAEAHAAGIVHRDLKPANLFFAERPDGSCCIKVLDFGISKYGGDDANPDAHSLTHTQTVLGSPRYMSPEQMRSTRSVGPPTDIWALGCILYELITAKPAFDASTAHGLGVAIATDPAPSVRALRPEVPAELDRVISRCLQKDPAFRVATVAELAVLLAPLAPKRSEVSIERIARLTRRSQRPPPPPPPLAFATTELAFDGPSAAPLTHAGLTRSTSAVESRGRGWQRALVPVAAAVVIAGAVALVYGRSMPHGAVEAAATGAVSARAPAASNSNAQGVDRAFAAPSDRPAPPAQPEAIARPEPATMPSPLPAPANPARAAWTSTKPIKASPPSPLKNDAGGAPGRAPVDTNESELLDRK